ncbi:MAG: MFS transporter [bacterium]|nr:MFS transporter [bacterium]
MNQSSFKKYLLLWLGELISAIGGGLTSFGLGVYVFEKTGSAAGMAVVTLLGFLPTLVLSVPAGILADRYDRRMLMMIGDGCSAIGIIYILICMMRGETTLAQICIGVFISSVFSSLLEPSYKATVSDLLTEDEYANASGLVSLAGSARYLISPVIAGILLSVSDVKLLLVIDICTFMLTVTTTFVVKKGIAETKKCEEITLKESLAEGWQAICERRGVLLLVLLSSLLTLFIGVFQILAEPLILSIADAKTLGIAETICASGMLVSSIYLGIFGIKSGYVKILSGSLVLAGGCIIAFGLLGSIPLITLTGFGFFAMLPFANTCLDYLVRTNTAKELQGRIWGLIGFLSQIGYVVAYACSGVLADRIAGARDISVGRGAGVVMSISGAALMIMALILLLVKEIRLLEEKGDTNEYELC